jgi:endoglucanase
MEVLLSWRSASAAPRTGRRRATVVLAAAGLVLAAACSDGVTDPFDPGLAADAKGGVKGKPQPEDPDTGDPVTPPPSGNPLAGVAFYLEPNSHARRQADAWYPTRPADALQMEKIAAQPQAKWLGSWLSDPSNEISKTLAAAAQQNSMPVLVAYNITNLDCGSGGAASADAYRNWISRFAAAVGNARAVVILEPDALPAMGCLSSAKQQERIALLSYAVRTLKAQPNVRLYIDAGHPQWHPAAETARRLNLVSIGVADGFSLNVSNFVGTDANVTYGADVSARLSGKHFVVDTGRNGLGPTADYQWCNPSGRGLGVAPGTLTAHPALDAYLWIKPPGESDGTCNGGPTAGAWWADYALGLAQRS